MVAQEKTQFRNEIVLLTKQFVVIGPKKINIMDLCEKASRHQELDFEEEGTYLDKEMAGFRAKEQGSNQDNQTSREGNQSHNNF